MSHFDYRALASSADQLVRDKFYNGKELAPTVKASSLYQNRLHQAIDDINSLMRSIQEYNSLYPVN